jgi:P-type Cu+ transporter
MTNTASEPRTNRDPSSQRPDSSDVASDPVCGMDVNRHEAGLRMEWEGDTYYFCSQTCRTKFEENPEKYG